MSVREYIGARYVPVFAKPIEWDNTRTYEPLTIVAYQGNSYTSTQSVPTGIDITNENYWVQTGNYNAQVEAYRQEVQRVSDELAPFVATSQFVSDTNIPSWVGIQNDTYTEDEGTRLYIIPRDTITHGVGGAIKIFADNYPNTTKYRDMGIYYSADQNNNTGENEEGVFWLNIKNVGYSNSPDLGVCFNDGQIEVLRIIETDSIPGIYIGNGTPTLQNASGEVRFGVCIDRNVLLKSRLYIGSQSLSENQNTLQMSTLQGLKVYIGGNQHINAVQGEVNFDCNISCTQGNGLILSSPNGNYFKVSVNDAGQLSASPLFGTVGMRTTVKSNNSSTREVENTNEN